MVLCPRCGRDVAKLVEGLCEDCYFEVHKFYRIKDFQVVACMDCGAILVGNRWVRPSRRESVMDLLRRLFVNNVKISNGRIVNVEAWNDVDHVVYRVTLYGSPHPEIAPREEQVVYRARIIRDLCPDCRLARSGAERGILQIRGFPHLLDEPFMRLIISMINNYGKRLSSKNIGSILDVIASNGSIDVIVTSVKFAKQLAHMLSQQLPSTYFESYKLVGEKRGRKIYHVSISFRVATFRIGDVVDVGGELLGVTHVSNKWIRLVNLSTGKTVYLSFDDLINKAKLVGSASEVQLSKVGDKFVGEFMGIRIELDFPVKVFGFVYKGMPYIFKVLEES